MRIWEYSCIYKKAQREYKNQIKKNALQEIAELLKAAHGVNLNVYPFVHRVEMANNIGAVHHIKSDSGMYKSNHMSMLTQGCLRQPPTSIHIQKNHRRSSKYGGPEGTGQYK